jgi:mono/diheme cytochrome c family protein
MGMKIFVPQSDDEPAADRFRFGKSAGADFFFGGARCCFAVVAALAWMFVSPGTARAQNAKPGAPSGSAAAGNAANGRKFFATHACSTCHGAEGQGATGPQIAPPPVPLPAFVRYVRQPVGLMPPFNSETVSDAELADVYAFLKSAAPAKAASEAAPPGNAEDGKKLFVSDGCYECHGYEGQGAQQTNAATIGPPPLPFEAFAKYVHHPTGAMPPYTDKVLSEAQLADIYAYLKTIPQPPSPKAIPLLNQ